MRSRVVSLLSLLLLCAAPAVAREGLVLSRVLLSSGGVGYYEFEASVDGNAELSLQVRLDQVDDVLKSIVVFDDQGGIGAIRLPGRQPLDQLFRDLPFRRDALASPVTLLNALQGAVVTVAGPRPITGRILRVLPEREALPNGGGTIDRHRVTIVTDAGLQQFILEQANAIAFADPELQRQIDDALRATARHRAQDRRQLTVVSRGAGKRTVRVGYVTAAPLWKASYRLILSADDKSREALLQGWAVLENFSGRDWNDVDLTLVSGNPVTFRQALYQAYFVNRPEVPVEVLGRVLPKLDKGAVAVGKREAPRGGAEQRRALRKSALVDQLRAAAPTEADAERAVPAPTAMAQAASAASVDEATTQVVFHLPRPVSVASSDSLVLPVIDRTVPAARLSLYQPAAHASRPLAAIDMRNDGESGLPPGVLTLYERDARGGVAFVGDARLASLPAGEQRLLSYAVDGKTKIDREQEADSRIATGRLSRGLLQLTRLERQRTIYRIAAPAKEPRAIVIEHPRRAGWSLAEPGEDKARLTPTGYRLALDVEAGAERSFTVVLERPVTQQLRLLDLGSEQIAAFAEARELDEKVRDAFAKIGRLKRSVDERRRAAEELSAQRKGIFEDQQRIRQNMRNIPRDSDVYRRYLAKLSDQEDRLETLDDAIRQATKAAEAASDNLRDFVLPLEL